MKHMICMLLIWLMLPAAMAEDNRYDAIDYVGESGYVAVQRNGLWGMIDHTGTLLVPCEWDRINLQDGGELCVCRDGLYGYIDLQGNVLLPVEWDWVYPGRMQSCFSVRRDGLYGLADSQGRLILPLEKGMVGEEVIDGVPYVIRGTDVETRRYYVIENGMAREVQIEKKTVMNAVPDGYKMAYMASTVGWWVESKTRPKHYRFADRQGNFLTEDVWDEVDGFYCGLSMVKKDGKVGFVNEAGEIAIPLVYDGAWSFSDDMALVRQGTERFWIDTQGNRLFNWDWARGSRMYNGMALVATADGLYGVIDKRGELIIPCEWDAMIDRTWPFTRGEIMQVGKDGLWGFLNKQGELITGRLYEPSAIDAEWYGAYLFLLEGGALSVWHADGTKIY